MSTRESTVQSSSILQAQAINSAAQKRPHLGDGESHILSKNRKRKREESGSSVVAATSIPQMNPAFDAVESVSTRDLDVSNSPSPRKDKKKKKKKRRKMSIVNNSEFEGDRAKRKQRNGSVSIVPSTSSIISQASALSRHMKPDDRDSSDAESVVALLNNFEKKKGKISRPPSPRSSMSGSPSPSANAAAQAEINGLRQQLEAQSQLLKKYQSHLASIQHSLTCQICLDLMYKPFALAPCGHVACYGCLVRWFTAPGPGENAPDNQNGNQNDVTPNGVSGNHVHKRKTCPICRSLVIERPVEVWAIKDMVNALVRSKLVDVVQSASAEEIPTPTKGSRASGSDRNAATDPWQRIFRPTRNGRFGRWWPGWVGDVEEVADRVDGTLEEVGMYDAEDHVHRCLDCMHEIWGGRCSNCDRVYPGHPEADEEEESSDPEEMIGLVEEDESDEDMEDYGLTLGQVLDHMYGEDHPMWEFGPGEDEEEEFYTDAEDDWVDERAFAGVFWDEPAVQDPVFAHLEEVHDDGDQRDSDDDEDRFFVADSEEERGNGNSNEVIEIASDSGAENVRDDARRVGRAARIGGQQGRSGARRIVTSEDEGERRRQGQRRNTRRNIE